MSAIADGHPDLNNASLAELMTMLDRATEALETLDELHVQTRQDLIGLMEKIEQHIDDADE